MAPGTSLGAHGTSWRLLAEIYENHGFIKQNACFSFPRASPNVSHELYSRSFKIYENHCFVAFWIQGQKNIKSSIPGLVLSASGAQARKSSNRASLDWFSRCPEPKPESHQIELPRTGFIDFLSQCRKVMKARLLGGFLDFWSQGQKVIKSSLLGFVLSTSGAKAEKSSNRVFWIRRALYYPIIVYCVICLGSPIYVLTEPAKEPQKICVYAQVSP